ncbi:MAG: hypothetical protein O3C43_16495 [Verrucomicrobia bacterium]|nr:hypothetical protein [Verrucomicrobiota bacterium]MDA1068090.1 hypothetical protein [Verrucomicrobiota bacterium]
MINHLDGWHLHDPKKKTKETKNRATKRPEIVANMRNHYDAFVGTLPPGKPSIDYKNGS